MLFIRAENGVSSTRTAQIGSKEGAMSLGKSGKSYQKKRFKIGENTPSKGN